MSLRNTILTIALLFAIIATGRTMGSPKGEARADERQFSPQLFDRLEQRRDPPHELARLDMGKETSRPAGGEEHDAPSFLKLLLNNATDMLSGMSFAQQIPGPRPSQGAPRHTECQTVNGAARCVSIAGEGMNQCDTDSDCASSHTACRGNQCIRIPEPGNDECQTDADCPPRTRLRCRRQGLGAQCALVRVGVQAANYDACQSDDDCDDVVDTTPGTSGPSTVFNGRCKGIDSDGDGTLDTWFCAEDRNSICSSSQCFNDADCQAESHTICSGSQCVSVKGHGRNQCASNIDCACAGYAATLLSWYNQDLIQLYAVSNSCEQDCGENAVQCTRTTPVAEFQSLQGNACMAALNTGGASSWTAPCPEGDCPWMHSEYCDDGMRTLLKALVDFYNATRCSFRISSFGGGTVHMCTSDHYNGLAIDFVPLSCSYQTAIDFFRTRVHVVDEQQDPDCDDHLHLETADPPGYTIRNC